MVGAFYTASTLPSRIEVETVIPRGLWRKQPLAQWLLEEGGLNDRSAFVASSVELRAELRAQHRLQV